MLRKLALVVSFACLVFVAAMIVSCGSSKTHLGTMCTGGPFNVVGDWQGTLTTNGTNQNLAGVINSQGQALFFDSDSLASHDPASGSVAALPAITGACSFSGTATGYGAFGVAGGTTSGAVSGNVNSASSISGTITVNSVQSSFSLTSFSPLTGTPTSLAGNLGGAIEGAAPGLLPLTFTPGSGNNMTFTNDLILAPNCTTSGSATQEGTTNIFDISITISGTGAGCPPAATVTGLGFESNTDYFGASGVNPVPGTYLYAISSTSAFVLEVYPPPAGR
ncbi:MAG TPA: hypothetical protein VKA07_06135 [Candidatus Sulfotelmatobacter sp.]|nr:hypothetical protein [Candidatus Sulfotelmatobacter sp.]